MDKSSFSWPAEFVSNSDLAVSEKVDNGEQPVSEQAANQQAGSEGSVSGDSASEKETRGEADSEQPILFSVLSQIYEQTFGYYDFEDNKQERSANDALLLLSAHYRCTNNRYFITKIAEIYEDVARGGEKWTCDLWHLPLAKFAYSHESMGTDDARKVLKSVLRVHRKKNPGCITKNITISTIIALKKGLIASGAHINHLSAYQLIINGCSKVFSLLSNTSETELARIVGNLVLNLPHHLPPSPPHDDLFEANNYFILKDLKSCHMETSKDLEALDIKLDRMEEDNNMQDYIIQQVTSHHDYHGIVNELGIEGSDEGKIRDFQMQIIRKFAEISRSRFIARYPTAFLFADIDEQLTMHDIDISDLISSSNESDSGQWVSAYSSDDWQNDAASDGWYETPDRTWESVTGGDEGSSSGGGHTAWTSDDWASGAW